MKPKDRKVWKMALALLTAGFLFGGCESDRYYQQEAVDKAREFLLEECPKMPFASQEYVKFNRPFFLTSHLRGQGRWSTWQICVGWIVPGEKDAYLVFGTGAPSTYGWYPVRVLRRNYDAKDGAYYKLVQTTQEELLQKYYWRLRRGDLNSVRYTQPDLWETSFPLDYRGAEDASEALIQTADNVQYTQYAMVWNMPETPENCLLIVGYARDPRLGGWQKAFSGIYARTELEKYRCGKEPVRKAYEELSDEAAEDWQKMIDDPVTEEEEGSPDAEKPAEPANAQKPETAGAEKP